MAEKETKKSVKKNEAQEKNYVNPVISWSILGGELAVAIALALIFWL